MRPRADLLEVRDHQRLRAAVSNCSGMGEQAGAAEGELPRSDVPRVSVGLGRMAPRASAR
jgi:hypothetical protein